MKKTYINPVTVVINIETQQMIANSFEVTVNRDNVIEEETDVESRRSLSLWDDYE